MSAYDTFKAGILGDPFDANKKPSRQATVQGFLELQNQLDATIVQLNETVFADAPIYENTASGIAATSDGEQFRVENADDDIVFDVYSNNTGSAVLVAEVPSTTALATKANAVDVTENTVLSNVPKTQWNRHYISTESGNGQTATPVSTGEISTDSVLGPSIVIPAGNTSNTYKMTRFCQWVYPGRLYRVRWKFRRSTVPSDPSAHPVILRLRGMYAAFNNVPGPSASISAETIQVADTNVVERSYTFSLNRSDADITLDSRIQQFRVGILTLANDDGVTAFASIEIDDVTDEVNALGGPLTRVTAPNAGRASGGRGIAPKMSDQGRGDVYALMSRVQALENERLAQRKTRKTIWCVKTATGANDGTSEADAYTDLKTALEAASVGDVVISDAPESDPFPMQAGVSISDGVVWKTNGGPNGETWISGATYGTWTDATGGVFSIATAEPRNVVYDFKRDDLAGTVTGVDLTKPKVAAALNAWNFAPDDCVAWYGFLEIEGSPTTTPNEGKWSWVGGVLYINPPGSPTLTQVNDLAAYNMASSGGVTFGPKTGDFIEGFHIYGRLFTIFTTNRDDASGYGIRSGSAQNCTVEDVICIASGNHAVGLSGSSGKNNVIRKCIATGGGGSAIPYVFRSDINDKAANLIGEDLLYIAMNYAKTDGSPINTPTTISFKPNMCYSHGGAVDDFYTGIFYNRLLCISPIADIATKFSLTLDASTAGKLVSGAEQTETERFQSGTFSIRVHNSLALGYGIMPHYDIFHKNVTYDNLGDASSGANYNVVGYPYGMHIESCTFLGEMSRIVLALQVDQGWLTFINNFVEYENGVNVALINMLEGSGYSDELLRIHGNTIRYDTLNRFLGTPNGEITTALNNIAINSLGGNILNVNVSPIGSANGNSLGWEQWFEGVNGGDQDIIQA